jgi:DegV family protein with EDD domain
MNKVILFSESTIDITPELVAKYQIEVFPLIVNFEEETYYDGVNITPDELYKKVEEKKMLPKTSARTPLDYKEAYLKFLEQGNDVVHITLGSNFSSTYQNAFVARNNLKDELKERIFLLDGKNLSSGTALLLLKAAKLRDMGKSAKEIAEEIQKLVPRVKSQFVVESLEYLHKGGRCSTTKRLLGTVLRIKPMIVVRAGRMDVGKSIIGSMKKSLNEMVKLFLNDFPKVDPEFVFITETAADKSYRYLAEKIEIDDMADAFDIYPAGCDIGSHHILIMQVFDSS